jgi:hypothetical protein
MSRSLFRGNHVTPVEIILASVAALALATPIAIAFIPV